MADGVTKLGGGWDGAPQGSAEARLGQLIAAGQLTGDALCQQMNAEGYSARGPAYYPAANGTGPFYALGNPHDYAALNVVGGVQQWDLIGFDPSQAVISVPPTSGTAAAPPSVTNDALQGELDSIVGQLRDTSDGVLAALSASEARIIAAVRDAQQQIQSQIDQVVKNAETSAKQLIPIVEAAVPALGALLPKN